MKQIELTVAKSAVYNEVAKTTSYTGARMVGDDDAYLRIFTTDEDQEMLERFWEEAASGATEQLKPFLHFDNSTATEYEVVLEVSSSYDETLTGSVRKSLFSYFVAMIVARWYRIANKQESESYANDAIGAMDDVMKKIYYRKKPVRVVPNLGKTPDEQ